MLHAFILLEAESLTHAEGKCLEDYVYNSFCVKYAVPDCLCCVLHTLGIARSPLDSGDDGSNGFLFLASVNLCLTLPHHIIINIAVNGLVIHL